MKTSQTIYVCTRASKIEFLNRVQKLEKFNQTEFIRVKIIHPWINIRSLEAFVPRLIPLVLRSIWKLKTIETWIEFEKGSKFRLLGAEINCQSHLDIRGVKCYSMRKTDSLGRSCPFFFVCTIDRWSQKLTDIMIRPQKIFSKVCRLYIVCGQFFKVDITDNSLPVLIIHEFI